MTKRKSKQPHKLKVADAIPVGATQSSGEATRAALHVRTGEVAQLTNELAAAHATIALQRSEIEALHKPASSTERRSGPRTPWQRLRHWLKS